MDDVGEEQYELYDKSDIGDIIGVTGEVFRTKRGEISVAVRQMVYLSKSLRALPEKCMALRTWNCATGSAYVDLITNWMCALFLLCAARTFADCAVIWTIRDSWK
jgi:lysyl-tRNA synthetase class 2